MSLNTESRREHSAKEAAGSSSGPANSLRTSLVPGLQNCQQTGSPTAAREVSSPSSSQPALTLTSELLLYRTRNRLALLPVPNTADLKDSQSLVEREGQGAGRFLFPQSQVAPLSQIP